MISPRLFLTALLLVPALSATPINQNPDKANFSYIWQLTAGSKNNYSGIVPSDKAQDKESDPLTDYVDRPYPLTPLNVSTGARVKSFASVSPIVNAIGATEVENLYGSYDVTTQVKYSYRIIPIHQYWPANLYGKILFTYDYSLFSQAGAKADVSILIQTEGVSITHKFGAGKPADTNVYESFEPKSPVGSDVIVTIVAHASGSSSGKERVASSAYLDPVFTLSEEDAQNFEIIYSPNLYGDGPLPDLPDVPYEVAPEPSSFALIGTGAFLVTCLFLRRFFKTNSHAGGQTTTSRLYSHM